MPKCSKTSYNEKLDQLRKLRDNSKQLIEELQDKYRESTGVPSLKIKHKTTWGYFIEINSRDHKKLDDNIFKHFQTKVNSMCYKTEVQQVCLLFFLDCRVIHLSTYRKYETWNKK